MSYQPTVNCLMFVFDVIQYSMLLYINFEKNNNKIIRNKYKKKKQQISKYKTTEFEY